MTQQNLRLDTHQAKIDTLRLWPLRGHVESNQWPLRFHSPKLLLFMKSLNQNTYIQNVASKRSQAKTNDIFDILDSINQNWYLEILFSQRSLRSIYDLWEVRLKYTLYYTPFFTWKDEIANKSCLIVAGIELSWAEIAKNDLSEVMIEVNDLKLKFSKR